MSQIFPSGKNVSDKYDLKAIDPTKVLPKMDLRQIAQSHTRAYEETQGYSLSNNEGATSAQQPNLSIINTINIGSYEKDLAQLIQTYVASNSYLDVDGASTANNIVLTPRKIADIISPNGTNYAKPTSLPFAYRDNLKFAFRATLSNTGAVQISIKDNELSGLTGSISLVDETGASLAGGEIIAGKFYEIVLTGTGGVQKGVLIQPTIDTSHLIGEYSNATLYNIGAVVKELGSTKLYNSLTNGNIGNPLNNPTNWEYLTNLKGAINTVAVRKESDFGTSVLSQITLTDFTKYHIGVPQLITTAELILPANGNVQISGQGLRVTTWIFAGSAKTLFNAPNLQRGGLYITELTLIDGVGNNILFDCEGHPTLSFPAELYSTLCIFYGWGSRGTLKNLSLVNLNESEHYNNGELVLDNIFALSFNNYVSFNFYPNAQGVHFTIKTNVNQANISASAFGSAKNEAILYIDPAIVPESGIAIGTAVPYQGLVFGLISLFEDIGGGKVRVTCPNGISFANGDIVLMRLTANYNGAFAVSNVVPFNPSIFAGTFEITTPFLGNDGQGQAILLNGAAPRIEKFFQIRTSGVITNIANNGSGFVRITSVANGLTTGKSLYISNTNYDQGGYAVVITPDTFDLLDVFGSPVPFVAGGTTGNWSTNSLDQTNNVVTALGAGGIIPDSQTILDASTSTLFAFAGTTTFSQVIWTATNSWTAHQSERFSINRTTGVVTFIGDRQTKCYINLELNCAKSGGGTVEVRMNPMYRPVGGVFTEVARPRAIQSGSSSNMQVIRSGIILTLNFGDSIAFGMALDAAATLNINSALFQLGIA